MPLPLTDRARPARCARLRTASLVAVACVVVAVTATAALPAGAGTGDTTVPVARNHARAAGLAGVSQTWSAKAVDYNRDGHEDVWVSYHARGAKLWRNRGNGTYRRVARTAWPGRNRSGRVIDRHDCAWADVDRNGRPDAYCTTGRFTLNIVKTGRDNELWLQNRRGRFRDVGTAWGLGDVCARGRFVTFIHANRDRFPDLFVGNDVPRRDRSDPCNGNRGRRSERSKLWVNVRGDGFRYAPRLLRARAGIGTRCAEVLDFDGDGWQDLLACRNSNRVPRLYRNRSGRGFADVTTRHDLSGVSDATVADLDGDGDGDIVTTTRGGAFGYHLNVAGRFARRVVLGRAPNGRGRSVAAGDADLDGDVDVYGMVGDFLGNEDDAVWLNAGLRFSPVPVPSAGGTADGVIVVHPVGARAWFLALNGLGRFRHGPVQLVRVGTR